MKEIEDGVETGNSVNGFGQLDWDDFEPTDRLWERVGDRRWRLVGEDGGLSERELGELIGKES